MLRGQILFDHPFHIKRVRLLVKALCKEETRKENEALSFLLRNSSKLDM